MTGASFEHTLLPRQAFSLNLGITNPRLSLSGSRDYRLSLLILNAFDSRVIQQLCSIDKPFNLIGLGSFLVAYLGDQGFELIAS